MTQWQANNGFTNRKEIGVIGDIASADTQQYAINFINNGGFYYQELKLKVLKGTRGFLRLAGQDQTSGAGDAQNSSTSVVAIINDIATYTGRQWNITPSSATEAKEIYFDTCNGDVDLKQAFIVRDLNQREASFSGYLRDKNGLPVEGAVMQFITQNEVYSLGEPVTDHNGYYQESVNLPFANDNGGFKVWVQVEQSCVAPFSTIQTFFSNWAYGKFIYA